MARSVRGMLYLPTAAHYVRETLKERLEEFAQKRCPPGSETGGQFTDEKASSCGVGGGIGAEKPVTDVGEINGIEQIGHVPIDHWQRNHGISRGVMESIGFNHYDQSDPVDGMDPQISESYGTSTSAMAQMRGAAAQSGGVIMTRNAIPGSPVEADAPILPQTRPDEPILSSENMKKVRDILHAEGITPGKTNQDVINALDRDPELKAKVLKDFGAKYLFPAGEGNAARVDLPPHGENVKNFMEGDGRVYLAMEGSLKTSSVLTALESSGRLAAGESVIGVPSVTLWQTKELDWAAKEFLQGRDVVLIPDADGVTNPAVINQARALQSKLEGLGAGKVVVAAPPLGAGDKIQEVDLPSGGKEKLKGVDDFLGAGRGSLGGLAFVDRQVDKVDLSLAEGGPSRVDGVRTVENALRAIAHIAGPSGTVRIGSRTIGAAIGRDQKVALNSTEYLERMGLIKVEHLHEMGPKRIQQLVDDGVLPRESDGKGGWKLATKPETLTIKGDIVELDDNLKSPVITIVNPEHRAKDAPVTFLADRIGGPRVVRTPEGAAHFGLPIGSAIPEGREDEFENA